MTEKCNFKCKHCYVNLSKKDISPDIVKKILRESSEYPIDYVSLTGGEPFCHDNFEDIIKLIVSRRYKFSINTNGYDFPEKEEFLKKYKDDIHSICFSVDGADEKTHDYIRKKGSFKKLIKSFELCNKLKIPIRLGFGINKVNFNQVLDMVKLAERLKVCQSKFFTILPNQHQSNKGLVLNKREREILNFILNQLKIAFKNVPIVICADLKALEKPYLCGSFLSEIVSIDADGNLTFCCELDAYNLNNSIIKPISLRKISLKDAIAKQREVIKKIAESREEELRKQENKSDIDFNSCFYCLNKFKLIKNN